MRVSLFKIIFSGWIGDRPLRLASVRAGSGRYPDCDGSRGLIRGNYHLARRGKWDARILEGKGERKRELSPWPQRDHYRAMCATALSSFPWRRSYLLPYYVVYALPFYLLFLPRRRWIRSQIRQGY